MKILIVSLFFLCVSYFPMKSMRIQWEKRQLPSWSRYFLGVLAWGALLSFVGILWGLAQPIIDLFTSPNYGVAIQLVACAYGVLILVKQAQAHPQLFDFDAMKPFLKDSLAFANPARSWMFLKDEVEKHEVRRVYKETTGKDLPDEDARYERELQGKLSAAKKDEFFYQDKRVPTSKKKLAVLNQPIESLHTKQELQELEEGKKVDISDTWFLTRQKKSSHDYFHLVRKVEIDPVSGRMELLIQRKHFTDDAVRNHTSLFKLKQNVYDFIQSVHQQDWVQPYLKHVSLISCTCCYVDDETFAGPEAHPVCRVELSRTLLKSYEAKYFDVGTMNVDLLV